MLQFSSKKIFFLDIKSFIILINSTYVLLKLRVIVFIFYYQSYQIINYWYWDFSHERKVSG